jgi:hypothetical protein
MRMVELRKQHHRPRGGAAASVATRCPTFSESAAPARRVSGSRGRCGLALALQGGG